MQPKKANATSGRGGFFQQSIPLVGGAAAADDLTEQFPLLALEPLHLQLADRGEVGLGGGRQSKISDRRRERRQSIVLQTQVLPSVLV